MKNSLFITFLIFMIGIDVTAQIEYKVITSVESIVTSGLGRSRMVSSTEDRNYKHNTTNRSEEDDERNKSDR